MSNGTRDEMIRLARACTAVGRWLSAAIDDPKVCAEMKADIRIFFDNFDPAKYENLEECAEIKICERTEETEYVGPKVRPGWMDDECRPQANPEEHMGPSACEGSCQASCERSYQAPPPLPEFVPVPKTALQQCPYDIAWVGRCKDMGTPFCEKHAGRRCAVCGQQAVRECSETTMAVCGTPLCATCKCPVPGHMCW